MTEGKAITFIAEAYFSYMDSHPKAKKYSPADLNDHLGLCDADYQELCKALGAKCQGGHTDPLICAGVFADAVFKAMDTMEEWMTAK